MAVYGMSPRKNKSDLGAIQTRDLQNRNLTL
ncbi:hypothetical protein EZS27_033398, partial [termite gut metagenome]